MRREVFDGQKLPSENTSPTPGSRSEALRINLQGQYQALGASWRSQVPAQPPPAHLRNMALLHQARCLLPSSFSPNFGGFRHAGPAARDLRLWGHGPPGRRAPRSHLASQDKYLCFSRVGRGGDLDSASNFSSFSAPICPHTPLHSTAAARGAASCSSQAVPPGCSRGAELPRVSPPPASPPAPLLEQQM